MPTYSLWMSEPQFAYVEIAHPCGIRRLVIDIEHGLFPLGELDGKQTERIQKMSEMMSAAGFKSTKVYPRESCTSPKVSGKL